MYRYLLVQLLWLGSVHAFSHGVAIVDADNSNYLKLDQALIDVSINNQIATVQCRHSFTNEFTNDRIIKYAFPLPGNANPISLKYRIGSGDWVTAEFNSNIQDDSLPGSDSNNGSQGSSSGSPDNVLDDYLGETPFYFEFANPVPANEEIEVELVYVQLLAYEFGIVEFNFPNDYTRIQNEKPDVVDINIILNSARSIDGFQLINHDGDYNVSSNLSTVRIAGNDSTIDKDIHLQYELASDELGAFDLSTKLPDSLFQCDDYGSGFLTMIIEPEASENAEVINKNFVLVIDRSGSMNGEKMRQAKSAAEFIVDNLNVGDKFNIVDFSGIVRSFAPDLVPVSDDSKTDAIEYIFEMEADGSTNISGSLEEAIENFKGFDETEANIIIFFTDGKATSGITSTLGIVNHVELLVNFNETGVFLFTFGIGDSVQKDLLSALAVENNGLVNFLEDQDLEEEITNFFLKINNPVLINTQVEFSPDIIHQINPNPLPNLYKGQQMILSGRYDTAATVQMKLTGNFYNNVVEYNFPITLNEVAVDELSVLPKIWAKQRIDELSVEYHLAYSTFEEFNISQEIDQLGACYGVVNVEFNSFTDVGLEVDFISFSAERKERKAIELTWVTAVEVNNAAFLIERSCDGTSWEEIGKVPGQGSSSVPTEYRFDDKDPCEGVNYYRVVAVDLNGRMSYSEIQAIDFTLEENDLRVFPNPVSNSDELFVNVDSDELIKMKIFNPHGKLVKAAEFYRTAEVSLDEFEPGVYVGVFCTNASQYVKQIVVKN